MTEKKTALPIATAVDFGPIVQVMAWRWPSADQLLYAAYRDDETGEWVEGVRDVEDEA